MKQAAAAWEVGWERIGASWDNFFHSSTAAAAAKVVHNMSRKGDYYTVQTVNILPMYIIMVMEKEWWWWKWICHVSKMAARLSNRWFAFLRKKTDIGRNIYCVWLISTTLCPLVFSNLISTATYSNIATWH